MYMFRSVVGIAVFAAAYVAAQSGLAFTSVPSNVVAGQSYTITWSGGDATQPVSIILRSGNPANLDTIATLTSSATGGSYTWNVPTSITNMATYALQIQQGTVSNYSPQFAVSGGTGSAASGVSSPATTPSSASALSAAPSSPQMSPIGTNTSSTSSVLSASLTSSKNSSLAAATAAKASSSSSTVPSSDAARGVQNPLALVLGAIAAIFYLA